MRPRQMEALPRSDLAFFAGLGSGPRGASTAGLFGGLPYGAASVETGGEAPTSTHLDVSKGCVQPRDEPEREPSDGETFLQPNPYGGTTPKGRCRRVTLFGHAAMRGCGLPVCYCRPGVRTPSLSDWSEARHFTSRGEVCQLLVHRTPAGDPRSQRTLIHVYARKRNPNRADNPRRRRICANRSLPPASASTHGAADILGLSCNR